MNVYFSDYFGVSGGILEEYGAFNPTVVVDLPLFVDPFLLFHSKNPRYQDEHEKIIGYLRYLRDLSVAGKLNEGSLRSLFCFPEVDHTWLGFSQSGNKGHGLGMDFARALADGLSDLFSEFGKEKITASSHLEKLCLIRAG